MFRFRKQNEYFRWGLTVFITVIAILAVYDILFGSQRILGYLGFVGAVVKPILYGCAIAYLMSPISDFFERTVLSRWARQGRLHRKPVVWVRVTSVLMTLFVAFGAIGLLFWFLIPNVLSSAMQLIENLPVYAGLVEQAIETLEQKVSISPDVEVYIAGLYGHAMEALNSMTSVSIPSVLATVSGGVMGMAKFMGNLILGFVVAAYIIGTKETLSAQSKKLVCALFDETQSDKIMNAVRYTDEIFGGFVRGDLLDALIVGILSFVFLNLFGIPYAPLLSVLIGVTNLIPFFGPFLGAIPSCVLIVLVDPVKCLEFIIFILILQQIDGNVLKPKILGRSIGLASLWIIIAILVGGGLFGPIGMLLGCPAFALIYALMRLLIGKGLSKRDMPLATDDYRDLGLPNKLHEDGEEKTS